MSIKNKPSSETKRFDSVSGLKFRTRLEATISVAVGLEAEVLVSVSTLVSIKGFISVCLSLGLDDSVSFDVNDPYDISQSV